MSYINRQGGVVSKTLNDKACTLFKWLIPTSIRVRAIHQPGINELADFLLHNCPDLTEWCFSERVELQLFQLCSTPHGDLFASHLNHQLPFWFCWTSHPLAAASDALSQPWKGLSLYTFPPIPLLQKTLVKIREDQAADEVIIITPSWPRRSWYHLLQMACKIPLLLPCRRNLLSQCQPDKGTLYHTNLQTLRLTVWKLIGMPSRIRAFQTQLSRLYSLPLEIQLEQCIGQMRSFVSWCGEGVRIPFVCL